MDTSFRLFPDQASTVAPRVDALYFFLIGMSVFFTVLIAGLIVLFALRYRRGSKADRTLGHGHMWAEAVWIGVPLVISMVIFVWAAKLYFFMVRPPADAMEINVVAKQWMWKFQHPQGNREIDNLHVPAGRPVKLRMISQDVIHSFFVPAFRTKQDVIPGRYTTTWFEATQLGEFHLFCAEYCGTNHSLMKGRVTVMAPADYQAWLGGTTLGEPPAVAGQRLFEQLRCASCHQAAAGVATRGPPLEGLFGQQVPLVNGQKVLADDDYLRESILKPRAKVVAGFQPIMPTFEGQVSEEGLMNLIAYIKSLGPQGAKP
jgi:cytochrome c oxidase subunit 2